jgi:hypothetical protein
VRHFTNHFVFCQDNELTGGGGNEAREKRGAKREKEAALAKCGTQKNFCKLRQPPPPQMAILSFPQTKYYLP